MCVFDQRKVVFLIVPIINKPDEETSMNYDCTFQDVDKNVDKLFNDERLMGYYIRKLFTSFVLP